MYSLVDHEADGNSLNSVLQIPFASIIVPSSREASQEVRQRLVLTLSAKVLEASLGAESLSPWASGGWQSMPGISAICFR